MNPVVFITNESTNDLPQYMTKGSAGMDLRAFLKEPITLAPMERRLIPTGLAIHLPVGYEAQIRPRSGLAYIYGVTVLNAPGTIDSDYVGPLGVLLINLSAVQFFISNGDRIAQMVISKHEVADLVPRLELDSTERGSGGFGSTGTK